MSEELKKNHPAAATGNRFASVADLMKGTDTPQPIVDKVAQLERESRIVGVLISMRQQAKMTQQQMAEKIGLTQGAISKLESSNDADLTFEEVRKYSKATGQRLIVNIGKPMSHVEAVKYHAFGIKEHLSSLAEMAHQDGDMKQAIQAFFGEAFFYLLDIFDKCQNQMPSDEPEIRIKKVGSPIKRVALKPAEEEVLA